MDRPFDGLIVLALLLGGIHLIIKGISVTYIKSRLIRKGSSEELAKVILNSRADSHLPTALKWGMIFFGLGGALVILQFLPFRTNDPLMYGILCLGASAGLIGYYVLIAFTGIGDLLGVDIKEPVSSDEEDKP